jgi:hypothetical protein
VMEEDAEQRALLEGPEVDDVSPTPDLERAEREKAGSFPVHHPTLTHLSEI